MKSPGLSRPLGAATLFLAVHLGAAEGSAPGGAGEKVAQRAADRLRDIPVEVIAPDMAKPAAGAAADVALRRELTMRFDRNGDGRLDAGERAELRAELLRRPGAPGKGLLDAAEAAQLRRVLAEEFRASAPPPETVAERLARRRAESLKRADAAK